MGSCYSFDGYVNAILRRSAKTLLVEGVSDVSMLNRLLAEDLDHKANSVMDSACIVSEGGAASFGNKERVVHLRQRIGELSHKFPKLNSCFASLIDREWDGLKFNGVLLEEKWTPPEQLDRCFVTVGHSVENYYFELDLVVDYLKFSFPGEVNEDVVRSLMTSFSGVLAFGVCYSLCAKDFSCIKKCLGLLKVEHVSVQDSIFSLNGTFLNSLRSRNFEYADAFVAAVNESVKSYPLKKYENSVSGKLLHGHLGSEAIWVCAGVVLKSLGVETQVVSQVVTGRQKERERFTHDWVARHLSPEFRRPLDDVIRWMNGPGLPQLPE